jgi:hypothetical protein
MSNAPVPAERPAPTTEPTTGRKLLKGGAAITHAILKKSDIKSVRWLYGQLPHLAGVVWQLAEGGELFAFEDELMAHFEAKSAEAKANALAAAEGKATEKEALLKTAAKAAQPASAKSRKPPAPKARAARKASVRKTASRKSNKAKEEVREIA